MACLREPALQEYLEEKEPSPRRRAVEARLAECARCRSTFDRLLTRDRRVNSWMDRLSPPAGNSEVDLTAALAHVLDRADVTRAVFGQNFSGYEIFGQKIRGGGTNPRALASSVILQSAVVAVLMSIGANQVTPTRSAPITLFAPPPADRPLRINVTRRGGGGQHSPLPPLKGRLPKPAPRIFTPPLVTIAHPALTVDPSLIAPPDAWTAPANAVGNPLGPVIGAAGPGRRGGIGPGADGGVGGKTGAGIDGTDTGAFDAGGGVTPPLLLSQVEPEYSDEARKAKYSGTVMLSVVVGTDGLAGDIRVVRGLGMGLDEKAVEAVRQWRFKPGTNKGVPVRVRSQILIIFRML